jgi:uncharacterized protein
MHRLVLITVILLVITIIVAGEVLTRPAHSTIGLPPSDLPARSVVLRTPTNETVAGWLVCGKPSFGAVVLLHGVRGDRRQMLGRAKFLNKLGYTVLLIDLPGHGESTGTRITFGVREAEGVETSLAYLGKEFPTEKIGIVGVSLGAASTVLALSKGKSTAPDAIILESMFPTITEAVSDRLELHLGQLGKSLTPLLLWQLPLRLGFNVGQLRPIVELPSLHLPILIASGSEDRHTTLDETKGIFQVANQPKELWILEGAAHEDLHTFDPKTYQTKIADFLAKQLGKPSMRSKG